MCSIAKVSPNLWMPISKQQTSLVYGNMLNNFNPNSNIKSAPTEVLNANKVLRTPNRSNGNRSTGTRSTGTRSIVNGVSGSGGSTVGGNNNNNEIRSPNRGRTMLNQRLRAKGFNNANRIALLNNYNKGTMNVNKVITKANQIINNKRSNPAEMNLGAAIMSGEGMKRQRNNTENNRNAVIAKLQAQLARAQAALVESTQAANAAARNARNARNASNAQAAKNAANEANAKVKRQERALKQLQTNASLAGVSPNQGLRKSKRQK